MERYTKLFDSHQMGQRVMVQGYPGSLIGYIYINIKGQKYAGIGGDEYAYVCQRSKWQWSVQFDGDTPGVTTRVPVENITFIK